MEGHTTNKKNDNRQNTNDLLPIILEIVFRWFSFFSSPPAHLELELELFEFDDIGDDDDDDDDLLYH